MDSNNTSIVLGIVVAVLIVGLMYMFNQKSELELKTNELQQQMNATNALLKKKGNELANEIVTLNDKHKKDLEEAAQKLLKLRVETCVAIDNEVSGYNQEQCKVNKTLDNSIEIFSQSTSTLLAALVLRYTSSNNAQVNRLMKLHIDSLIALDANIEKLIDKEIERMLTDPNAVSELQRACKKVVDKYDVNESSLYKTLSPDQAALGLNARGTHLLTEIIGSSPLSISCGDVDLNQEGKPYMDCSIGQYSRKGIVGIVTSNGLIANSEIPLITETIKKTIEFILGRQLEICSQVNKTSDAQQIKQILADNIKSLRQALQISKNNMYAALLEAIHKQARLVNKPVNFDVLDYNKYNTVITRNAHDPKETAGINIGDIRYVFPDAAQQQQPPPVVVQGIKPRPTQIVDCGYNTMARGWVDAQKQGPKNDYCRFVGDGSWFACQLAGKSEADGPGWHLTPKGQYTIGMFPGDAMDIDISGTNCK